MQVTNSNMLSAGLQGYQRAEQQATQASWRIAQASTNGSAPKETPSVVTQQVSLADELVTLKQAELHAEASAKVIQTADDMVGTLIDVRA